MMRNHFLVLAASAALTACGGGGGGSNPPPPATAVSYHYYSGVPSASSAVGGLFSVSSASPLTPATVDSNALATDYPPVPAAARRSYTVDMGTLDALTGTINNYRSFAVVYAANGRLYKQYADQAPAPVQISNVSTITAGLGNGLAGSSASDLCYLNVVTDFANPENSIIVYGLAGANLTCGNLDDTYAWLRLNTSTSTAPTALTSFLPVAPVYGGAGAITNLLALDVTGALVKLDANFGGTPTPITGGEGPFPFTANDKDIWVTHLSQTRILLLMPGAGAAGELRIVDASANTLTGLLGSIANRVAWSLGSSYNKDSSYVYFVGNDTAGTTPAGIIQRFPVDGLAAAAPFHNAGAVQINYLFLTANYVVYWVGTSSVASIPKTGGAVVPLATSGAGELIFPYGVSNTGYVYYDRVFAFPNTTMSDRAQAIRDDGTGLVTYGASNGAQWSGFNYVTAFNLFREFPYFDHLVVAEYAAAATTMAGSTLSVVSAGSAAKNGTVVGTVPAGIQTIFGFVYGGTRGLWEGYDGDQEMFYVDTAVAGSLTRVTTDSANQQLIE